MSWTADAPSGTYRNHALSARIRDAAVADSQFMPFIEPEGGYGKGKGKSITITRFHNLPLGGKVDENTELPSGRPLIDTIQQEVSEWGFKVKMTEFEENLTHFDLKSKIQRALRDQLRLTTDRMIALAFKSTFYKVTSASASTIVADTDGTMSSDPTHNLSVAHVREIHDIMSGDLKIPPFSDGRYACILSTRAARGLKNDADYKDWISPTSSEPLMRGELKTIEDVRFIETNHYDALDNSIGSGVTGEAIFFGADAAFLAMVEEPDLRRGIPTDLGRFYDLGWVGTMEAGNTWPEASQARTVHWTAATNVNP